MELTLRYIEIDAVQGDDITEALRDTASPDCAEFFHGSLPSNASRTLWIDHAAQWNGELNVRRTRNDVAFAMSPPSRNSPLQPAFFAII
ncbi:hypothetical protein I1A49_28320 [Streptomyces malaysiensis subsp. malaysiensis]|uniref:Uncharacterized protein n=1 Tax=Streptomyces malaysiensis TaxID=92644 RepID=A0ABX6WPB6_STRMQ|nr:hypothetical protein [Streptomyces solisilvae]QPI62346.1 hypothetical protein I1A49_28320 [Streptomyces solisilvae]